MNGIQTLTQVGAVPSAFSVIADTLHRKFAFGTEWTRLRVGFRARFSTTGTIPTAGRCPFFFGVDSSNAAYGFPNDFNTDPTGVRAIGMMIVEQYAAGTTALHYDPNASGNLIIDQVGGAVVNSSQIGGSPQLGNSNTNLTVVILELTRGSTSYAASVIYPTAASTASAATFNSAMAAATMEDALAVLGGVYAQSNKTLSGSVANDAYGIPDRICLSSFAVVTGALPNSVPSFMGQNLAARRIY